MRWSGKASLRTWALGRNEDFERELGKGEANMKTVKVVSIIKTAYKPGFCIHTHI